MSNIFKIQEATLHDIALAIMDKRNSQSISVSEMAWEIAKIKTEPILQEIIVKENKEIIPPEGIDGFSKVIVEVPQQEERGTTSLNFDNWTNGSFVEILEDNTQISHEVIFNTNGIPTSISGIEITGFSDEVLISEEQKAKIIEEYMATIPKAETLSM